MRALRCVLGALAGCACLLVVAGGVAVAAPAGFGSLGEESGQLNGARGVAVDQESGDVYVVDQENERIDKFGGGGEFLFAWGEGVADGHSEAPQTCTTICFQGMRGSGAGEFWSSAGVAVDNDPLSASHGDVYVLDARNYRVEKFDSAGNFVLMFGGEVNTATHGDVCLAVEAASCGAGVPGVGPGEFEYGSSGIVVDSAGDVFVGDANRVQEFGAGGAFVGQIAIPGAGAVKALAVDSGGDVYVLSEGLSGVRKFDGAGVELGEPRDASGTFSFPCGVLALGPAGELFIAEGEGLRGPGEAGRPHVLEFDASGNELARFDSSSESGGSGLAFSEGTGELYVVSTYRVRVVSIPPPGPLVVAQSAGELRPTTAGINTVVNAEGHETAYHVEYGTSVSYGASTVPTTLSGSAFEDEPVSVLLGGLQPGTAYHYRVVASNSAGTTFGEDDTFTTLPPVLIDSESVSDVTSRSATLAAQINPLGKDTKYHLEYGPSTAYGSSVPVPDGDAGADTSDVSVSALVEGLSPSTTYHYRVVAYNSYNAPGTVVEGPDHVFTTQGGEAPVLPDGRAWEMVSPPQKHGFALDAVGMDPLGADMQAAADGSAIVYAAQGPINADAKSNRSLLATQILATRTADGWSSVDLATPHETVTGITETTGDYQVFSPDLSVGLLVPPDSEPLSPQATERTPYLSRFNGEYEPLVTAGNVPPETKFGQLLENGLEIIDGYDASFVGASPDLSHVIISSGPPLTEGIADTEGRQNLFEWSGGVLRLVSVLPDGKAATEEDTNGRLGFQDAGGGDTSHAVSDDGSRVVWGTTFVQGVREPHLYLTDLSRGSRGETVQLDPAEAGARGGKDGQPRFATASSDGSKVFFADGSRLTSDSRATSDARDLYMCAVGEIAGKLACHLKDLTAEHNLGASAGRPGMRYGMLIGAGEDGRYVYFVDNSALAAGATHENCPREGEDGVCNLYVYDTVLGEARFVARLSARDYQDWNAYFGNLLGRVTAGVSPDGRYLAFMSERSLTGYDNIDARSGQPDVEVFLYDAVTGRLVCASCNPSGSRPSGVLDTGEIRLLVDGPGSWRDHWLAGSLPGWTNALKEAAYYRSRYLSNSGRLFFDSADALVPRDANGKEDVYEYEPPGGEGAPAGDTCTTGSSTYSPVSGGCVGLISSGTSGEESAFLDASETGGDVFFLTASQLVPQDVDSSLDLYDARVCSSSSPCLTAGPVASPPCATADACRTAPSSQPGVFGAPPSATFSGAGNPAPGAGKPAVKKKVLTVAQKRAAALRRCRVKPRRKRLSCEAQVRRSYRVGVKAKRSRDRVTTSKKGSR